MNVRRLSLALLAALSFHASAYEQATHAVLTDAAVRRSALASAGDAPSDLVRTLGLDVYAPFGDDTGYFEMWTGLPAADPTERIVQGFERKIFRTLEDFVAEDPISKWLMYGAIREDDNPNEDPATPQDVAPGLRRPLHHFYDPAYNRPLAATGVDSLDSDVHRSPDWAIGSRDSFNEPNTPEARRRNAFSIIDAREAMLRALTLTTYDGSQYTKVSPGTDHAKRQADRRKYWATTFRALGDALHLNQDMGQPQHTRNEPHSGKVCLVGRVCVGGHTSVYEKYMKARTLQADSFNSGTPFDKYVKISTLPIAFPAYPVPAFPNYADYWSTAPGSIWSRGAGLADYSNRGFFTAAKNFGTTEYINPPSDGSAYTITRTTAISWDGRSMPEVWPVLLFQGAVPDGWLGSTATGVPLTTLGYWDQFLSTRRAPARFTLNRLNYDVMANLLMPRTASYSAGLINFFFRGRIAIDLPDEGAFALTDHSEEKGFSKVLAKVSNATPPFYDAGNAEYPQIMLGGDLIAVMRFHKDLKYQADLESVVGAGSCESGDAVINYQNPDLSTECRDGTEQVVVSKPITGVTLGPGDEQSVEFDFSASPIPVGVTDVVLQVVYRGQLGNETNAIAVGTVDVSEPTYFTYMNASDYIHIANRVYTREEVESDLDLLAKVQPQSCVDYHQSPARLLPGCLTPFPIDLSVSFGDLANPIAHVESMPAKAFIRFVYLTLAEGQSGDAARKLVPRKAMANVTHSRVSAQGGGMGTTKALLNQEGTCLPHDPFDIPPRHARFHVISYTAVNVRVDKVSPLRGVNGWYNAACVVNGDDATPGAPDDRVTAMAPLAIPGAQAMPIPVTIMSKYSGGAN